MKFQIPTADFFENFWERWEEKSSFQSPCFQTSRSITPLDDTGEQDCLYIMTQGDSTCTNHSFCPLCVYILLLEFRWLGKFPFQFTSFSGSTENDTEITQMKEMGGGRESQNVL